MNKIAMVLMAAFRHNCTQENISKESMHTLQNEQSKMEQMNNSMKIVLYLPFLKRNNHPFREQTQAESWRE